MLFRAMIIGGTGQVGGSVVRALAAESSCLEIVMVNRRGVAPTAISKIRQVTLDTTTDRFQEDVAELSSGLLDLGDPLYGACCIGVGRGSAKWSEQALKALEIGVVGSFARGCRIGGITRFALLSAAGSTSNSWIRYARIMRLKEETVRDVGFRRLAIFRPGIIAGNAHTPDYIAALGRMLPGPFGTIRQGEIGDAFAHELADMLAPDGIAYLGNREMRVVANSQGRN